jgi:DNA-directed RNA polymerase subunit RPC12/RpoP
MTKGDLDFNCPHCDEKIFIKVSEMTGKVEKVLVGYRHYSKIGNPQEPTVCGFDWDKVRSVTTNKMEITCPECIRLMGAKIE